MVHRWQVTDARATRRLLDPDILLNGSNPPPSDLLPLEIWSNIMHLADHVSITVSNHHGHLLKLMYSLDRGWVSAIGNSGDAFSDAMIDVMDEFHASLFLLLHGFYRQSISGLRSVLECSLIGAHVQLAGDSTLVKQWHSGREFSFGAIVHALSEMPRVADLEKHLRATAFDDLFSKRGANAAGWSRRLYKRLCSYTHSRPGFTNLDLWRSNGPVYVRKNVFRIFVLYLETYAIGLAIAAIARPGWVVPATALAGFEVRGGRWRRVAREVHAYLQSAVA